ncbi:MAG: phospholipase D-like domain-containing protein, partial [Gemmatimonadales bacterium]
MTLPAPRLGVPPAPGDEVARALDRAAGARAIAGNAVEHFPDSPVALAAMLDRMAAARHTIHFENYIIRSDRTGRRFAELLAARARAGITVRVLYDAFGCRWTSPRLWQEARRAGVETRAFNPLLTSGPFELTRRDHRKLLVVDGGEAILGGACIGDEWAGDPARGRRPWRDTMLAVRGPAVAALDAAFARTWRRAGAPLPPDEWPEPPPPCGDAAIRVIDGVPGRSRTYRTVGLLASGAAERLWITDAYLVAPPPLFASVVDAARGGVDVRLLLPGVSDIPIVRTFTRIGYRELLAAGVRIFEWPGPMLHAKTTLADRRWARVGSSNLNVSSLLGNYELDVLVDSPALAEELATQFRRDLAKSREIALQRRRLRLPPRLVKTPLVAPADPHRRSRRELGARAVITVRQVAGGLRRAVTATAALGLA